MSVTASDGPVWSPEGDAIYFVRSGQMVRREVRLGDTVELGAETEIFAVPNRRTSTQYRNFDIHPDGDRFLFVTNVGGEVEAAEPVQASDR